MTRIILGVLSLSLLIPPSFSQLNSSQRPTMQKKVKLIIDTDGVSDDIRALSIALSHPHAEVIAVTTTHGCVDVHTATANVARVMRACGAENVPIYKGAEGPILGKDSEEASENVFFGKDGLGDKPQTWPQVVPSDFSSQEPEVAALALIRLTREHPEATLVCIGPLTNVALAIRLDSKFASQPRKMVIMGGNYYGIGNVNSNTTAEYNFHGDPEAAAVVLKEMKTEMTIVPWEAFFLEGPKHKKVVDFDAHWKDNDTPLATFLKDATSIGRALLAPEPYAFCDEIAISTAIDEDRVVKNYSRFRVKVELAGKYTRGQVAVDWTDVLWKDLDEGFMASEGKQIDRSNRAIKFVTSYDVITVEKWLQNTVKGERDITKW